MPNGQTTDQRHLLRLSDPAFSASFQKISGAIDFLVVAVQYRK
jgi:hypothetical protein